MKAFSGLMATLVALISLSSCDDDPPSHKVITIVTPQDGDTIGFAEDTDFSQEGLNTRVLVVGENLAEGEIVRLTVGDATVEEAFHLNPITFRDVNLGTEPGEVTISATLASNTSITSSVTVTLVETCSDVQITRPLDGANFRSEDDESSSELGFQYTITASTDAGDGVTAELYVDGDLSQTTTVSGTVATFAGITLAENAHDYEVRIEGGDETCEWPSVSVTVDTGAPTCDIVAPDDVVLNAALDQDTATDGMQTAFEVVTETDASISVRLVIDGRAVESPTTTDDGTAEIQNVGLNEGDRDVHAICTDSAGNQGVSASRMYTVDTVLPNLRILTPTESSFIRESDDAHAADGVQFEVELTSNSDDVEGQRIEVALEGTAAEDYGIGVIEGGAAVLLVNASLSGPVAVEAALWDEHDNTTVVTVDVTIDIDIPNVLIREPTDGAVLAMSSDLDPVMNGLQYTVIACASEGGEADLLSETRPIAYGGTVTEASCDTGAETLPYTITFESATIGEGTQRLHVEFTDLAGNVVISPGVEVTVDTDAPYCFFISPICGSLVSVLELPIDIEIRIDAETTCTITDESGGVVFEDTVLPGVGGYQTFVGVTLASGANTMVCTATDEHGNSLVSEECVYSADNVYLLDISEPTDGALLGLADDRDDGAGYAIQVCANSTTVPIGEELVFEVDGVEAARETFSGPTTCVDLPITEGDRVVRVWVDVDGDGTSDAEATNGVTIDITPPPAVTGFGAVILDRRETSIRVTWNAPAGEGAASHEVVWSHGEITTVDQFVNAHSVPWTAGVIGPGDAVEFNIHDLTIERDYYIAVRAMDGAGNPGDYVALAAPLSPTFQTTITEAGPAGGVLGFSLSGAGDLDGDGVDDFVAGGASSGHIFFGPAPAAGEWAPDVTFSMPGDIAMMAGVRDFNGDGHPDVAIGAPFDGEGVLYIYYGGPTTPWLAAMNDGHADIAIAGTAGGGTFGWSVATAGDFCGEAGSYDGYMDIAVSAPLSNTYRGYAYVICGEDVASGLTTDVDAGDLTVLRIDGATRAADDFQSFGVPIVGLGDINGDDLDDLAISHYRLDAGEVYVVRGMDRAAIGTISPLAVTSATQVQTLIGENTGDFFGWGLAGVGDVDNDGFADLIVSAYENDAAASNAGLVYVYLSDGSWLDTTPATISPDYGYRGGDRFGRGVAAGSAGLGGAADLNLGHLPGRTGSVADLLIVSRKSGSSDLPGRIFVMFGGSGVVDSGDSIVTGDIRDDDTTDEPLDGLGFFSYGDDASVAQDGVAYIGDINDDGYLDFAVGDTEFSGYTGHVVVYY